MHFLCYNNFLGKPSVTVQASLATDNLQRGAIIVRKTKPATLQCSIKGYPPSNVTWFYQVCSTHTFIFEIVAILACTHSTAAFQLLVEGLALRQHMPKGAHAGKWLAWLINVRET